MNFGIRRPCSDKDSSSNDGDADVESTEESKTESLTSFVYRKMSGMSSSLFCRQNSSLTVPISPACQFKIITRSVKPDVTVAFKIVGMPDYMLSSGKSEDMIAEKISNDPNFGMGVRFTHVSIYGLMDIVLLNRLRKRQGTYCLMVESLVLRSMMGRKNSKKKQALFSVKERKIQLKEGRSQLMQNQHFVDAPWETPKTQRQC